MWIDSNFTLLTLSYLYHHQNAMLQLWTFHHPQTSGRDTLLNVRLAGLNLGTILLHEVSEYKKEHVK